MFIILTEKTSNQPVYVNIDLVYMMQEHEEETLLFTREQCIIVTEKPKEIIEIQNKGKLNAAYGFATSVVTNESNDHPKCVDCLYCQKHYNVEKGTDDYYCSMVRSRLTCPENDYCHKFEPKPEGDDERW